MMIYVVLWANYGDQGVDFLGVFKTIELAEKFITNYMAAREIKKSERQWFDIVETQLHETEDMNYRGRNYTFI